jgi:predicted nucleotidyltransferase
MGETNPAYEEKSIDFKAFKAMHLLEDEVGEMSYGNVVNKLLEMEREQKEREGRIRGKQIVKSFDDILLQIYPATLGMIQYMSSIPGLEAETLENVNTYLINNGVTDIYVAGSSLYASGEYKHADIDILAVVPDAETGARVFRNLKKELPKGIAKYEENPQTQYFVENVLYRVEFKPKNIRAVPIDVLIVTKSKLEEELSN